MPNWIKKKLERFAGSCATPQKSRNGLLVSTVLKLLTVRQKLWWPALSNVKHFPGGSRDFDATDQADNYSRLCYS
jgi:hypothetical protein